MTTYFRWGHPPERDTDLPPRPVDPGRAEADTGLKNHRRAGAPWGCWRKPAETGASPNPSNLMWVMPPEGTVRPITEEFAIRAAGFPAAFPSASAASLSPAATPSRCDHQGKEQVP